VDAAALRDAIVSGYRWLPGMEALLAELCAAGVELHALSNYPDWWRLIEERLRLSRYLRWSFVSCRTGVRKPDAECFLGAARALGVPPEQCLFIDDRPGNVAAAESVGMPALLFTDAASLRAALVGRSVLPR
jgi:HAD superfamily hydrolase (TIGR01509 family)